LLAPFARFHVHHIVPKLGAWLSKSQEYDYLQASIQAFPSPEAFAAQMTEAGLHNVRINRMSFDAVHLYLGVCP
jgi:demethylmenaquinone methyltransferase/2-methoxy-6-polyprenyl-1,4-benzoquinol methylase